jgi:CRP-like cAMP-binding protein
MKTSRNPRKWIAQVVYVRRRGARHACDTPPKLGRAQASPLGHSNRNGVFASNGGRRLCASEPCVMLDFLTLQQNQLLAALSPAERERIYPHLQLAPMRLGQVLYEPSAPFNHVYFPVNCIVSLLRVLQNGASAEISVAGKEGLVGIAFFMGGETAPTRAVVQSAGYAYRLLGRRLQEEFHQNGRLQLLLLRFTQALITQMAQTAVCNRHHSVDQQLCRRLLLSLDRLQSNQLSMTQELIADMLGVRREGVSEAANKLQDLGVIRYRRGQIRILDRVRLEQLCCECYAVVKRESDRLVSDGFTHAMHHQDWLPR